MNLNLLGGIAARLAQLAAASYPQEFEKKGRDRLGAAFAALDPVTRGEFDLPSGALARARPAGFESRPAQARRSL